VQALGEARVLAARASVALLLADAGALAEPVLAEALRAAGLSVRLHDGLPPRDVELPASVPLPRGRAVRITHPGVPAAGTVVDAGAGEVTVRVAAGGGWSFPTVPAAAVEPVDPTAEEAAEMGLAALAQQDGLRARLWLVVARLRSAAGLPLRAERLAGLLD
jgi:hypothetical protein